MIPDCILGSMCCCLLEYVHWDSLTNTALILISKNDLVKEGLYIMHRYKFFFA